MSFEWIKRNWKGLAIMGGGIVAIVVLTLVILARREDRGFMVRECTKGEGIHALTRWAKEDLPLPVVLEETAVEWKGHMLAGIEFWNQAAGVPLFRYQGVRTSLESTMAELRDPVVVVDRINAEDHGATRVRWIGACRIRRAEVKVPGLVTSEETRAIVMNHELGHALGLDHDDYDASVMYFGGRAMRWGMREVTEADRSLLREEYGP